MSLSRRLADFTDPFMNTNFMMMNPFMNDPFFNRQALQDPWALMRGMSSDEFFSPRCDVWDSGNSIRVHADLPGVPKENVSVEIVNGNLQIQGETSQEKEYESFDSRVRERRSGKFSRIMALPPDIDASKVQAEFKNGVLELNILKKPESQPKRIKVENLKMTVDDIIHDDHHPQIKRIVGIAIDETDGAQKALHWAAKNVFREKTDLVVLLHSRPNSEVGPFGSAYTDADLSHHLSEQFEDSYKAQSLKVLRKAIEFLRSKNFCVKAISLKGDARDELTRKVSELKVNLLVIGSRGMGMIKRTLIGSTSDYITHHVHCPVLVFKN